MTLILDGKESEVSALFDVNEVVMFEVVNGEYRVAKLEGEANVQEPGA